MSEIAIGGGKGSDGPFRRGAMLLVVAIGTAAFIAMLVLGAYAPDLRSGHNGGAHALSNAATGFSGLVRLAEETGRNPQIVRSEDQLKSEDFVVITPEHGWTDLSKIIQLRGARITLLVLPKWDTGPDPKKPGWVRVGGLLPPRDPGRTLAPDIPFEVARARTHREPLASLHPAESADIAFFAPLVLQTIASPKLKPLITDQAGHMVLGQLNDRPLYVLSDPDLLNNHGMADERQAKAALALLDYLNSMDSWTRCCSTSPPTAWAGRKARSSWLSTRRSSELR